MKYPSKPPLRPGKPQGKFVAWCQIMKERKLKPKPQKIRKRKGMNWSTSLSLSPRHCRVFFPRLLLQRSKFQASPWRIQTSIPDFTLAFLTTSQRHEEQFLEFPIKYSENPPLTLFLYSSIRTPLLSITQYRATNASL
jgi:hypothetical protein